MKKKLQTKNNHLYFGNFDTVELAQKYGTPLYVMDEQRIREMCRVYRDAFQAYGDSCILYASKAFSTKAVYRIAADEGLGADVVSGGELFTALQAGFPAEKIYFHGNNKTPQELEYALSSGVGVIVADSFDEILLLNAIAHEKGLRQKVMLRVNTGVEAHTHRFIQTSKVDSKFGFGAKDGEALKAAALVKQQSNLKFVGLHSHIGSQIFEEEPFALAVDVLFALACQIKETCGFTMEQLNLGGGFGIWYSDQDALRQPAEYQKFAEVLIRAVQRNVAQTGLKKPKLLLEPGRSLVGEAGITLYTAGNVKEIPGIKKYVSVDGGMFENPRYALYQAAYTAVVANKAEEAPSEKVTIAGKCCESGDMLILDANLPHIERGDVLAVLSTGAYNYSMASHYNRNPIPGVLLLNGDRCDWIVRPETYEDLTSHDTLPEWLKK